jgi:acyl-homoserine lactone acylase PvdQ
MSIPTPTYPGVTITRNAQGWPIIDAPTIELAYEAFGYMVATDRGF